MRFLVGYQLAEDGEEPFVEVIRDYREHIEEVYFPWEDMPSGRAALSSRRGYVDWTARERLEQDLLACRALGMRLDLLFNANCYGGLAVSQFLENRVASVLEHLGNRVGGVDVVTTTSLAVARTVKRHFPEIEVRASVNMRIGSAQAMDHVSGLFDSFCLQRDLHRNRETLEHLSDWANRHGKGISILANSGCLRFCPGQTFHDNLVAHEQEVDETANIEGWTPHVCWNLYRNPERWAAILQATWIRPEDLDRLEGTVDRIKLATRMHANPRMVIHAYTQRRYPGNLLDLLEPGFGPAFAPYIIDNTRFPDDWYDRTASCNARCETCTYCENVLQRVLLDTRTL